MTSKKIDSEELYKKFINDLIRPNKFSHQDLFEWQYGVPSRSYWPYIKAALDKGEVEFNKLVESLFDGTFEFPPETPEEHKLRNIKKVRIFKP